MPTSPFLRGSRASYPLRLSPLPSRALGSGLSLHLSEMPTVKSLHVPLARLRSGLPFNRLPRI